MKSCFLSFLAIALLSNGGAWATDITPPTATTPVTNVESQATPATSPSVAVAASTAAPTMQAKSLPEIHATMLLPKDWTLLPGKLLEGDVLLATRERISSESDPWTTGLSMSIDRNGAKDSGQKASDYARSLAHEASEKAGEEASPIKESEAGPFHEIRFDFPVAGDQPLLVTEILKANDKTGTLAVILWQSPKDEAETLHNLREQVLAGIKLDPTQ
jgi:hypothetical protein